MIRVRTRVQIVYCAPRRDCQRALEITKPKHLKNEQFEPRQIVNACQILFGRENAPGFLIFVWSHREQRPCFVLLLMSEKLLDRSTLMLNNQDPEIQVF